MKFSDIVQWNCRGVRNKRHELQILADVTKAQAIVMQEMKMPENEHFVFSGFEVFEKYEAIRHPNGVAHGGVAIMARREISPILVKLNTHFQAVAVSVSFISE